MKHPLLSPGTKRLGDASPFEPMCGIGFRADDPRIIFLASGQGNVFLEKLLLPSARSFAPVRPGWHPTPPLRHSALQPRPPDLIRFPSATPPYDSIPRLPRSSFGGFDPCF